MPAYNVTVTHNPHGLDIPAVTEVEGRRGSLHGTVLDHLHRLLGTDDVRLSLQESRRGARGSVVVGGRGGRGGAALAITVRRAPPPPRDPRKA